MARFVSILRFGIDTGHEYHFARTRRENGAIAECDKMVIETISNMTEHVGRGGRVVSGSHPTDPNAVIIAAIHDGGPTVYKVVTYRAERPIVPEPTEDDSLADALLASIMALA